jgi:hypothetical protein
MSKIYIEIRVCDLFKKCEDETVFNQLILFNDKDDQEQVDPLFMDTESESTVFIDATDLEALKGESDEVQESIPMPEQPELSGQVATPGDVILKETEAEKPERIEIPTSPPYKGNLIPMRVNELYGLCNYDVARFDSIETFNEYGEICRAPFDVWNNKGLTDNIIFVKAEDIDRLEHPEKHEDNTTLIPAVNIRTCYPGNFEVDGNTIKVFTAYSAEIPPQSFHTFQTTIVVSFGGIMPIVLPGREILLNANKLVPITTASYTDCTVNIPVFNASDETVKIEQKAHIGTILFVQPTEVDILVLETEKDES